MGLKDQFSGFGHTQIKLVILYLNHTNATLVKLFHPFLFLMKVNQI